MLREREGLLSERATGGSSGEMVAVISASLRRWRGARNTALDRIAAVHDSLRVASRGRRSATVQINQAYAMLLSGHFQGFRRDLHSECADLVVSCVQPDVIREALRAEFAFARKLDRGNPNPGNIGAHFDRLGVSLWPEVLRDDARNASRQRRLGQLSQWRNAIAHQDLELGRLQPRTLALGVLVSWRCACDGLAGSFDRVIAGYVESLTGNRPW